VIAPVIVAALVIVKETLDVFDKPLTTARQRTAASRLG
jgi:hypothetical protein